MNTVAMMWAAQLLVLLFLAMFLWYALHAIAITVDILKEIHLKMLSARIARQQKVSPQQYPLMQEAFHEH